MWWKALKIIGGLGWYMIATGYMFEFNIPFWPTLKVMFYVFLGTILIFDTVKGILEGRDN